LELAADVLKEMDEDGSGEISFEEFSRWWKEYKQRKSKGMFRGLFGKRKKSAKTEAPKEAEPPVQQEVQPRLFGVSLSSLLGNEPAGSSSPAVVRALFERLDGVFGTLAVDEFCPDDGPSQLAAACQQR
jgi:hypothetical protein